MLNLSEEQQKALMETVNKHIQEETKKSLDAFDKTLDREVSLVLIFQPTYSVDTGVRTYQ